jgi:hypothetical protein
MWRMASLERSGWGKGIMNSCRICHIPIDVSRQPKIAKSYMGLSNVCVDCYLSEIASIVNAAVAQIKKEEKISVK